MNKKKNMPDFLLSTALVGIVLLMIFPINAVLLDFLFSLSFALSIVILASCVNSRRALDFSSFPVVLLLATLFRLALNVASTRLILSEGHLGASSAGKIIHAFGAVTLQGNYFVGFIVFAILSVINFLVITKGAERISEVSARFVLDSMPGKQQSLEYRSSSGQWGPREIQEEYDQIQKEADFYGSMDGASRFIKGDALAGILITGINLVGGLVVGIIQKKLSFSAALKSYSLLSIGDALVSQIPALFLSTTAALMITKSASSKKSVASDLFYQVLGNKRNLYLCSISLFVLGVFFRGTAPMFFLLSIACLYFAYKEKKKSVPQAVIKESSRAISVKSRESIYVLTLPKQLLERVSKEKLLFALKQRASRLHTLFCSKLEFFDYDLRFLEQENSYSFSKGKSFILKQDYGYLEKEGVFEEVLFFFTSAFLSAYKKDFYQEISRASFGDMPKDFYQFFEDFAEQSLPVFCVDEMKLFWSALPVSVSKSSQDCIERFRLKNAKKLVEYYMFVLGKANILTPPDALQKELILNKNLRCLDSYMKRVPLRRGLIMLPSCVRKEAQNYLYKRYPNIKVISDLEFLKSIVKEKKKAKTFQAFDSKNLS